MARIRITGAEVGTLYATAKRSGKTLYLWDTELKGLGLCVKPSGRAFWMLCKWVGGRRGKLARFNLGSVAAMSIDVVREKLRSGELKVKT